MFLKFLRTSGSAYWIAFIFIRKFGPFCRFPPYHFYYGFGKHVSLVVPQVYLLQDKN